MGVDWKEAAREEGHQGWAASLAVDWVEGSLALAAKTGQGSMETAAAGAAAVRPAGCLAQATVGAIPGSGAEPKEKAAACAAEARPEGWLERATAAAILDLAAEPTETAVAVVECLGWAMEVEALDWGVQEDWFRIRRDRCM